ARGEAEACRRRRLRRARRERKTRRTAEQRDELAPFHQQFLPCSEAEDSTAEDLLHCGISKEPLSAMGHQRPMRPKPYHGACPLCPRKRTNSRHVDVSALCQ